jgi:glycerophosphoryl diester phosphodiesterase
VVAHRGFSAKHPENTLNSIHAAVAAGCNGLEFDLHRTADGVLILQHDEISAIKSPFHFLCTYHRHTLLTE